MPPEAIDLASRLLQYSPSLRCTAVSVIASTVMYHLLLLFVYQPIIFSQPDLSMPLFFLKHWHYSLGRIYFILQLEACAHPFFDELREPNARLPNGRPFPPLFNFKQEVGFFFFYPCSLFLVVGLFFSFFFSGCLIIYPVKY